MQAKLKLGILSLAVFGAIGVAHADGTNTNITNNLSNDDSNTVKTHYHTNYVENLSVLDVFLPNVDALANANVNDVQANLSNSLTVIDPSRAIVRDSVKNISGNAGVNNAAGFFNQQANHAVIASTATTNKKGGARANIMLEQKNIGNRFRFGDPENRIHGNDMTATVIDSVKNINGNAGVNNASGAGNQQNNALSLASAGAAVLASASAGAMQINQTTHVTSYLPLNVDATVRNSVKNISGNVGVNNAAGLANQQINTLSVAASH